MYLGNRKFLKDSLEVAHEYLKTAMQDEKSAVILESSSFIIRLRTFMCRLWKNKLKPKLLRLWM